MLTLNALVNRAHMVLDILQKSCALALRELQTQRTHSSVLWVSPAVCTDVQQADISEPCVDTKLLKCSEPYIPLVDLNPSACLHTRVGM